MAQPDLFFITSFACENKGVHTLTLDTDSGEWSKLQFTEVENPFYICVNKNGSRLYAVAETEAFGSGADADIAAYSINREDGSLSYINSQTSRGTACCYLTLSQDESHLLFANYSTGNAGAIAIDENGGLGDITSFQQHEGSSVDPDRQMAPFAHSIIDSPDGKFVFVADLGIDKVMIYKNDNGTLSANEQPWARILPGGGPRHMRFHPNGNHFYVVNEMHNSVTHFTFDSARGLLMEQQTVSTIPDDYSDTTHTADIRITSDGKFLYATNRGHDSLAVFAIDDSGALNRIDIHDSLGGGPQNLHILPGNTHLICANMPGNTISLFSINADGTLSPVGSLLELDGPSCIERIS